MLADELVHVWLQTQYVLDRHVLEHALSVVKVSAIATGAPQLLLTVLQRLLTEPAHVVLFPASRLQVELELAL